VACARKRALRPVTVATHGLSPLLLHSFCMQHRVTWCAALAAIDNKSTTDSSVFSPLLPLQTMPTPSKLDGPALVGHWWVVLGLNLVYDTYKW
jgi:hypothetical protein